MKYKITVKWADGTKETDTREDLPLWELTRMIDKCEAVWYRVELAKQSDL